MPFNKLNSSHSSLPYLAGWYAILPSNSVKSSPLAVERFGLPLVLWRDAKGQVVIMSDRCPHRGAKLSLGKIENDAIRCPYHGFEFDRQAQCRFAPEFSKSIPKLVVDNFPVQEKMGMIWLGFGETQTAELPKALLEIDDSFRHRYAQTEKLWQSHISYCIENQLDYTHLPDVHHNTIGRNFRLPQQPKFELSEKQISIYLDKPTATLDFYFPNTWVLNVSKKMKLLVFFAPVTHQQTQLYLRSYSPILSLAILGKLLAPIFNMMNKVILRQDERVVSSQGRGLSYKATTDRLMKHDKAITYFREIWRKNATK